MFRVQTITFVRCHLFGIIDTPNDDWLVRVALNKSNKHFLAEPRPERGSPTLSRKRLPNPDPAGAVLVVFAFAIPIELHFYPAVFVDKDLLSGRAGNKSVLDPRDKRHGCFTCGPVRELNRNARKSVREGQALPTPLPRSKGLPQRCVVID